MQIIRRISPASKVWLVSDKVTKHFEQFNSNFDQMCKAFEMLKVVAGFARLLLEDAVD